MGEMKKVLIYLTSMVYIISPRTYVYLIGFYPALVNILSISLIICTTMYKQYKCIKKEEEPSINGGLFIQLWLN